MRIPTAFQRYGYIDSNLVKNLRNRLTAALLVLWNQQLGNRAVLVNEHPWLPQDVPYTVYFGMAMIPLAAYLAAAMIGGYIWPKNSNMVLFWNTGFALLHFNYCWQLRSPDCCLPG